MLKSLAGLCVLVVLVAGIYVAYLAATYIDETVVEGVSYGFTIGQTKREAYSIAQEQYTSGRITGFHVYEPFESFDPDDSYWALAESNNTWTLFASEQRNFFDTLQLRFTEGRLEQVHRHRQNFELP